MEDACNAIRMKDTACHDAVLQITTILYSEPASSHFLNLYRLLIYSNIFADIFSFHIGDSTL